MKRLVFCMMALFFSWMANGENLVSKKPYRIIPELPLSQGASRQYVDSNESPRLTDGQTGENWMHGTRVGWLGQGRIRVCFDLGTELPVGMVKCHVMGGGAAGVFYPSEIRLFGRCGDEKPFLLADTVEHPPETGGQAASTWMVLEPRDVRKVRYLEIELTPARPDVHLMADEIEVLPPGAPAEKKPAEKCPSLYPANPVPDNGIRLGFVYFGATTQWPPEFHMLKMRSLGFNAVHSECNTGYGSTRWKNLNPEKGVFCWAPLDRWIAGASEAGLHVPVMTGIEGGIPFWLPEEFPDAAFINPYGETVPGLIDFGHPGVLKALTRYLSEMAGRYRDSACIDGYIIGDEYSVYQNYYHKKNFYGQNFNPRMKAAFREYLRKKYGSVGTLNRRFGSHYVDFESITPSLEWITGKDHEPEWAEWCRFRELEAARIYSAMRDAIHKVDPGRKIVLSAVAAVWPYHAVSGVNLNDLPWLDAFGEKLMTGDSPDSVANCGIPGRLMRGLGNPDKKLWITNLSYHGWPNSKSGHVRGLVELMGSGADFITYFLWDIHGGKDRWIKDAKWIKDAPCFFYLDKDKNYTAAAELNLLSGLTPFLGRYGTWIAQAVPGPSRIGILLPLESYRHEFRNNLTPAYLEKNRYPKLPNLNEPSYVAMMAVARFANRENISFEGMGIDRLDHFKAVSVTGNTYLSDHDIQRLAEFVRKGGLLIADAATGTYDELGVKRNKAFADFFSANPGRLLILNPRQIQAEENRLKQFLKFPEPVSVSAGGVSLLRSGKDNILLLTNRGAYGSRLSSVEVRVSGELLPSAPFRAYGIEPDGGILHEILFRKDGKDLVFSNLSFKDALMVWIVVGDSKPSEGLLSGNLKKMWWNPDWEFRIPLRFRVSPDKGPFSAELNLTSLFAKAGIRELPSLDSMRIVKYDDSGIPHTVPLIIRKNKQFNPHTRYEFQAVIQDPSPSPDPLGFCRYDLYLSTRCTPSPECIVRESGWTVREPLSFTGGGQGRGAPVTERNNGMTFLRIPPGKYDLQLTGKNTEIPFQSHEIIVNGTAFERAFTDYPRSVLLPGIIVENELRLEFSRYGEIQLDEVRLLMPGTKPVPSPRPSEVFVGMPEIRSE